MLGWSSPHPRNLILLIAVVSNLDLVKKTEDLLCFFNHSRVSRISLVYNSCCFNDRHRCRHLHQTRPDQTRPVEGLWVEPGGSNSVRQVSEASVPEPEDHSWLEIFIIDKHINLLLRFSTQPNIFTVYCQEYKQPPELTPGSFVLDVPKNSFRVPPQQQNCTVQNMGGKLPPTPDKSHYRHYRR